MLKELRYAILTIGISLSSRIASNVAKTYWASCDKTHTKLTWESFKLFYIPIKDLMNPERADTILDAGCGSGEITYLFHSEGYNIKGFDSSPLLISKAKNRFGDSLYYIDDLFNLSHKNEKFSKILINNTFLYVHPACYDLVLKNIYAITADGGTVYLCDNPDYSKRKLWYPKNGNDIRASLSYNLSTFFPVYYPDMAAFWIKDADIRKMALKVGFSRIVRLDSWANYRSHYILYK